MNYKIPERELEAMHEFIEDTFDPDYGWVTEWEDEQNNKYLLDQWIQETEQAGI